MALLSTTHAFQGYNIMEYLGVVTGEAVMGANVFRDFFAGISDIVGGRSGAYENVLEKGRDIALLELSEHARARGANAVVGISFDYENIGKSGSMMLIAVTGTAVVVEPVSSQSSSSPAPHRPSPWT